MKTHENMTIGVEKNKQVEVKGSHEKVDIRTKDPIKDEKILVEMFNKHYINIVEKTSGIVSKNIGKRFNPKIDEKTIHEIIENYRNHSSIIKRKELVKEKPIFKRIFKAYFINKDLKENKFSENAKTALVRPIYKKDSSKIKNSRPVSLLNGFSKIYERFLHDSLSSFTDKILSKFVSAYRKFYSSNHVLLKLIGEWKKSLDDKSIIGAVLMYLSKAFDCTLHDLLVANVHAYGLSMDAITFIYSYMKRTKQGVKINDIEGLFKILYQEYLKDPS